MQNLSDTTLECRRYVAAIRKKMGSEPQSARLAVKIHPHELGSYYEVVCYYRVGDQRAVEYAFACESKGPTTWDDTEPHQCGADVEETQASAVAPPPTPENIERVQPF